MITKSPFFINFLILFKTEFKMDKSSLKYFVEIFLIGVGTHIIYISDGIILFPEF